MLRATQFALAGAASLFFYPAMYLGAALGNSRPVRHISPHISLTSRSHLSHIGHIGYFISPILDIPPLARISRISRAYLAHTSLFSRPYPAHIPRIFRACPAHVPRISCAFPAHFPRFSSSCRYSSHSLGTSFSAKTQLWFSKTCCRLRWARCVE